MAYERQYYTNGDVLDARQLNHMETGIKENSDNIGKLSEDIADLKENGTGTGSGATTAQASSLWAFLKKTAFSEQLTDEELSNFKTSWGITGESGGEDTDGFVNLFEGMTFRNTGYSGTDIDNGLPADRYINDEDMTFEAGVTYYSYMPSSINSLALSICKNNGDGTYSTAGVDVTRNNFYFNGNYDYWGKEKEDTEYLIADGVYLMEHKFTPTETFTGKLCYTNKCKVNSYPDYAYLFTKEYNPYMDSLE